MNEKEYINLCVKLGCVVCGMTAEFHHARYHAGTGRKNSAFMGFPLCPGHHRNGGYCIAIHAGRKKWESIYGSELDFIDLVHKKLGMAHATIPNHTQHDTQTTYGEIDV